MVSTNEPNFVVSVQENSTHLCWGAIMTGIHVLTVCEYVTQWLPQWSILILNRPSRYAAVDVSKKDVNPLEDLRYVAALRVHPYCQGSPRKINLAILELTESWLLSPKFRVANFPLHSRMSYYELSRKMKHLHESDCYVFSSSKFETKIRNLTKRKVRQRELSIVSCASCSHLKVTKDDGEKIKTNCSTSNDQFCGVMTWATTERPDFHVEEGAPVVCDEKIYGLGLGASKVTASSVKILFQGFQNSLSFLQLYLGVELEL